MNLYKIIFTHYAQKGSKDGVEEFLLAENDTQVYDHICNSKYSDWEFKQEEEFDIEDEDYNIIGKETFKERMIRLKGLMNDDDYELEDLYYGASLQAWEVVKENIDTEDFKESISIGVINVVKLKK